MVAAAMRLFLSFRMDHPYDVAVTKSLDLDMRVNQVSCGHRKSTHREGEEVASSSHLMIVSFGLGFDLPLDERRRGRG